MDHELATFLELTALGIVLLIIGRLFIWPSAKKNDINTMPVWPFEPIPFMTPAEVRFYTLLTGLFPKTHIFAQVQLSRLIQPDSTAEGHWLARINRMSVDYVLVDPSLQVPLLVIELDDWSHDREDRQVADAKKNKALKSAGIPIVRFDGRTLPEPHEIKAIILKALQKRGKKTSKLDLSLGRR